MSDEVQDAIENRRRSREELKAEWEALGLEPRLQSPAEMKRVLMTWNKADLVQFMIRAESDEIKARHRALAAEADANALREHALVLPQQTRKHAMGFRSPFNAWLINHKGQTLDASTVFEAGWVARSRAEFALEAQTGETP